jgi:hypothetical protein
MQMFPTSTRKAALRAFVGLAVALAVMNGAVLRAELKWDTLTIERSVPADVTKVEAVFRFRNAGPAPVTIETLTPACSCTAVHVPKPTYAPGEAGEIRAVLDTGGRPGRREGTINLTTDDQPGQTTVLTIAADVRALFTCEPRVILWKQGEPALEKPVEIRAEPGERILGVSPQADPAAASVRTEAVDGGLAFRLWLRPLSAGAPATIQVPVLVRMEGHAPPPARIFLIVKA